MTVWAWAPGADLCPGMPHRKGLIMTGQCGCSRGQGTGLESDPKSGAHGLGSFTPPGFSPQQDQLVGVPGCCPRPGPEVPQCNSRHVGHLSSTPPAKLWLQEHTRMEGLSVICG